MVNFFSFHLHFLNQFAVVGLLEGHVLVEGAADARVGHHRGEDLRAVDLFALQVADCYTRLPYSWMVIIYYYLPAKSTSSTCTLIPGLDMAMVADSKARWTAKGDGRDEGRQWQVPPGFIVQKKAQL